MHNVAKAWKYGQYKNVQNNIDKFVIAVWVVLLKKNVIVSKLLTANDISKCTNLDELKSLPEVKLSEKQRAKYECEKDEHIPSVSILKPQIDPKMKAKTIVKIIKIVMHKFKKHSQPKHLNKLKNFVNEEAKNLYDSKKTAKGIKEVIKNHESLSMDIVDALIKWRIVSLTNNDESNINYDQRSIESFELMSKQREFTDIIESLV